MSASSLLSLAAYIPGGKPRGLLPQAVKPVRRRLPCWLAVRRNLAKARQGQLTDASVPFFFSNPRVAADSSRRITRVVYPRGVSGMRWDIVLATSLDGGTTCAHRELNDDPSHCAMPRSSAGRGA